MEFLGMESTEKIQGGAMEKETQVTFERLSLCLHSDRKLDLALFWSIVRTSQFIFFCLGHIAIDILTLASKGELRDRP